MSIKSDLYFSREQLSVIFKYFPHGLVAFDLETTGLSPIVDKIVEISAIKITKDGVELFDHMLNPQIPIPKSSTDIHGINDSHVQDKPTIKEILPMFADFIKDTSVVAHNIIFDAGFLIYNFHKEDIAMSNINSYCSCKLARIFIKKAKNHKLKTLSDYFSIKIENHHRALDDAIACMKIFVFTLGEIENLYDLKKGFYCNFKEFNKAYDFKVPNNLLGLNQLVTKQQVVDIKYNGGSRRGQFRPVKLVSILPMPNSTVLYAYCFLSNIYKTFKLNKIESFQMIDSDKFKKLTSDEIYN